MRRSLCSLLALAALGACHPPQPDRAHVDVLFALDAGRPAASATPTVRALGAVLFEHRLGAAACRDCHVPEGRGQDGKVHRRNTPALADVARQAWFGWDGLASGLAAVVQAEFARHHGIGDDAQLRAAVAAEPSVQAAFAAVDPEGPPTLRRAGEAVAAHLATFRSRGRWDRYVEGDDAALTAAERAGVATFVEVGCATCHGGRNLGGGSAHKLGLAVPYPSADRGREEATGRAEDHQVWKAPMLRHVAHTPPYLHDGSVANLDDVVRVMARHELGKELAAPQVQAIATMLRAVGDVDADAPRPHLSLVPEHDHGR